jgi:hypothetical protein
MTYAAAARATPLVAEEIDAGGSDPSSLSTPDAGAMLTQLHDTKPLSITRERDRFGQS